MENTESLNFRRLNEILCESTDVCIGHEHLSSYFLMTDRSLEAQLDFRLGDSPALPASLPAAQSPVPSTSSFSLALVMCTQVGRDPKPSWLSKRFFKTLKT